MNNLDIQQKRDYIQWFLDTCLLKEEKVRALLSFIVNNESLLSRVNLVENIRFFPNAILISTKGAKTVSYLFRINDKHYEDVETVIYLLGQEPPSEINLWLSFDREKINQLASLVIMRKNERVLEKEFLEEVSLLEKSFNNQARKKLFLKKRLLELIDEALAKGDQASFKRLSDRYKRLSS